jgi:hypothetical protein
MEKMFKSLKHKSGRGQSSEHFWQVWLKSVQRFQRRRFKCEKLTDGRRRLPMTKAHMFVEKAQGITFVLNSILSSSLSSTHFQFFSRLSSENILLFFSSSFMMRKKFSLGGCILWPGELKRNIIVLSTLYKYVSSILSDESPLQLIVFLILSIFNNAIAVDIPNTYP